MALFMNRCSEIETIVAGNIVVAKQKKLNAVTVDFIYLHFVSFVSDEHQKLSSFLRVTSNESNSRKMIWTKTSTLCVLTLTAFSHLVETENYNDSIAGNFVGSTASGLQSLDAYGNLSGNLQSGVTGADRGGDWGEQHLDVKTFDSDYDKQKNLTSSDYEEEQSGTPSTEEILEYIYPKTWTWALIFFHCIVFVVGLVGNCLVCVAVYRNRTMRTVTNYFIVNLAVADFLVILFCLPPSVVWDVTSTWWFGTVMCKTVLYLQVTQFYRHFMQ